MALFSFFYCLQVIIFILSKIHAKHLGRNMIDIEKKWNENTQAAKDLIGQRKYSQIRIAELCLECCEITRGGAKKEDTLFTMKKFAKEIGVKPQTLSAWVCLKRNVFDKLPFELKHHANYTNMTNIARYVSYDTPKEEVIKRFKKFIQLDDYEAKIQRYVADLRALARNMENKSNVERCGIKTLEECMFYAKATYRNIVSAKKNLKPKEHGISSIHKFRATAGMSEKNIASGYYTDDDGFKIKITRKDLKVLDYVKAQKEWISPTRIGMDLKGLNKNSASAWACRSLNKFLSLKKVERSKEGKYKAK